MSELVVFLNLLGRQLVGGGLRLQDFLSQFRNLGFEFQDFLVRFRLLFPRGSQLSLSLCAIFVVLIANGFDGGSRLGEFSGQMQSAEFGFGNLLLQLGQDGLALGQHVAELLQFLVAER